MHIVAQGCVCVYARLLLYEMNDEEYQDNGSACDQRHVLIAVMLVVVWSTTRKEQNNIYCTSLHNIMADSDMMM